MPMGPSTCQCVPNKNHLGALKENKKIQALRLSLQRGLETSIFIYLFLNKPRSLHPLCQQERQYFTTQPGDLNLFHLHREIPNVLKNCLLFLKSNHHHR